MESVGTLKLFRAELKNDSDAKVKEIGSRTRSLESDHEMVFATFVKPERVEEEPAAKVAKIDNATNQDVDIDLEMGHRSFLEVRA